MSGARVYLAGPEVFLRDARDIGESKKSLCRVYGLEGLFPMDEKLGPCAKDVDIYRANVELMKSAKFGVFNLTPFRGTAADVGTVFELGLMRGLGKHCLGYTNDVRDLRERVASATEVWHDQADGTWRDHFNMSVENFGNADNLMIDCSLREGGFAIVRNSVPVQNLYTDMRGFEVCLKLIEAKVRGRSALKGKVA